MKTLIVTGAAGFLGRYVVRHFARAGWGVIGLDDVPPENAQLGAGVRFQRMKLPAAELSPLLRATQPTALIHCAGRASVPLSMEDPAADFRDNAALTFELLDAVRRDVPTCRFVLLSSAAVYGNPVRLPVEEGDAIAPLSPYGYHKRICEIVCEEAARLHGVPTVSARIFSAYGPGLRRQVVWDICERIITAGQLQLRGTGAESRDFIHAADIAHALAVLVEKAPAQGEVYNVASGREVTIAQLAGLLAEELGGGVVAKFDGSTRAGDPLNWRANISKIAELGFAPRISLEEGMRGVAAWAAAELRSPGT